MELMDPKKKVSDNQNVGNLITLLSVSILPAQYLCSPHQSILPLNTFQWDTLCVRRVSTQACYWLFNINFIGGLTQKYIVWSTILRIWRKYGMFVSYYD